ncbi:MAG: DUF1559 domain-containing protein [Candidatus Hydrogenedentes bacterium]|nr:DUF1559 domain-containing protein [Candidatus Hydrogenedentota bacterium]
MFNNAWRRMRTVEFVALFGIMLVALLVCVPLLTRAREAAHRASCQNNLKQMGIVFKMYSSENKDYFPPLSPIIDNWMFDTGAVIPEYLTDVHILICPDSPFSRPEVFDSSRNKSSADASCVSSLFYIYTGYLIYSDEQAQGLFNAYMLDPMKVITGNSVEVHVPVWPDSTRVTGLVGDGDIPLMWDRVPLGEDEFTHNPAGVNVLHFDGHVEFVKYSFYNSSNFFPATRVGAETFGSVLPELPNYCVYQ